MGLGIHIRFLITGCTGYRNHFISGELFVKPRDKEINRLHSGSETIVEDFLDGGGVVFRRGGGRSMGFIKGMECVAICDSLAGSMKEGAHFTIICAGTRFKLLDTLPGKCNIIPFVSCTSGRSSRRDVTGKTRIGPSLQSLI